MKNIVTLTVAGIVLWSVTVKLADFALSHHKQINSICREVRGMPLAVHARTVETDNVIDWATNKH